MKIPFRRHGSRKPKPSTIASKIIGFRKLISMGLVKIIPEQNQIILAGELWAGFTSKQKQAWYRNAYIYCRTKYPKQFKEKQSIEFFEIIIPDGNNNPTYILSVIYNGENFRFFK